MTIGTVIEIVVSTVLGGLTTYGVLDVLVNESKYRAYDQQQAERKKARDIVRAGRKSPPVDIEELSRRLKETQQ